MFTSKLEIEKHDKMFHPRVIANKEQQQQRRNTEKLTKRRLRLEKKVEILGRFSTRRTAPKKIQRVVKSVDTQSQLGGRLLRIVLARVDASTIDLTVTPTATCPVSPARMDRSNTMRKMQQEAEEMAETVESGKTNCERHDSLASSEDAERDQPAKSVICDGCNQAKIRLYSHLTKSEGCSQHYDMAEMQRDYKAARSEKTRLKNERFRLKQDPDALREKRRLYSQKCRSRQAAKDPDAFREKRRLEGQKSRLRQMEKDPIAYRKKARAHEERRKQRIREFDLYFKNREF